ncbi:hypothetical protein ACFQZQ_04885 [Lysobacter koreensis]|uniref:Dicarboxylate transport domain-containing protein n=2 Tax=Lysobacter koreensis TaxID=266122 RepID=A0ABW2YP82_9GAMM
MLRPKVAWLAWLLLPALWLAATEAAARTATARLARITTAVATLEQVRVELEWSADASAGRLRLQARAVDAPELGYRFRNLDWRCPLQRDGNGGWRCDGDLRGGSGGPLRLAIDLGVASTDARLSRGPASLTLRRDAATPDVTRIDLTRVPLAWTQALLAQAWPQARLTAGTLDGQLAITAAKATPLHIAGPLSLRGAALDTPDGMIAAENLGARLALDATLGARDRVIVDGQLLGGELLFGTTYVSLQQRPVALRIEATQQDGQGWQLPHIAWRDDGLLALEGSAALTPGMDIRALDLRLRSDNLAPLRDGYLSGWLGLAGLADLQLSGAADARVRVAEGVLREATVALHGAGFDDPQGRFDFDGLDGDVRFSSDAATPVHSELRWRAGALYGLAFGPARLPFASGDGALRLREAVALPMLGGHASFDHLQLRPPSAGQGLDIRFGLTLEKLDVAQLAEALDWPAFTGELSGRIPQARYANDRLDFDGGLAMQLFGGSVAVSSLAMERPFGVAPTLSADIALDDLDLESLTGVFGFGTITGTLDGRIAGLRLVDWEAVAFDAELHTDRQRGVRQRISQRAVQDLSSVGDASFVTSLQSQLIGLFDDFGYSRLGIACRLADEVCTMDGLSSAGQGFIIVQGSGLPRLTVVGFNRRVDWPTLVERLAAVGKGDVKPVVE